MPSSRMHNVDIREARGFPIQPQGRRKYIPLCGTNATVCVSQVRALRIATLSFPLRRFWLFVAFIAFVEALLAPVTSIHRVAWPSRPEGRVLTRRELLWCPRGTASIRGDAQIVKGSKKGIGQGSRKRASWGKLPKANEFIKNRSQKPTAS